VILQGLDSCMPGINVPAITWKTWPVSYKKEIANNYVLVGGDAPFALDEGHGLRHPFHFLRQGGRELP
jgi:hypothetical protein